jgi:Ca2+-binding EF-hand superfamily protein
MINRNEEQQLRENFKLLDKNGNGQISREELLEGYMTMYGSRMSKQEILD